MSVDWPKKGRKLRGQTHLLVGVLSVLREGRRCSSELCMTTVADSFNFFNDILYDNIPTL